jgi:hypothetical protein
MILPTVFNTDAYINESERTWEAELQADELRQRGGAERRLHRRYSRV